MFCPVVLWKWSLWSFDENYFNKIIPQMECHIRCSDCNEPISNFQVPRGRGGVAILWPSERDKSYFVKKGLKKLSEADISQLLDVLIDNIFAMHGGRVFQFNRHTKPPD
jgi:hypothetical protein